MQGQTCTRVSSRCCLHAGPLGSSTWRPSRSPAPAEQWSSSDVARERGVKLGAQSYIILHNPHPPAEAGLQPCPSEHGKRPIGYLQAGVGTGFRVYE